MFDGNLEKTKLIATENVMKKLMAFIVFAFPIIANAEVGGFINGGLSFTSFEAEDNFGDRVELDDGTGFNVTGGIRFKPGLMAKLSYSYAEYDGGDLFLNNRFVGSFDDEVNADELRIGFYYAPPERRVIGFRVGGGYERVSIDIPSVFSDESKTDGLFAEGAILINAGRIVTFDIGGALMAMEDEDSNDSAGAEFRAGAVFHVGPVDLGLAYRALAINTEYDDGDEEDDTIGELRLTIGGAWGYPGKSQ